VKEAKERPVMDQIGGVNFSLTEDEEESNDSYDDDDDLDSDF